MKNVVIIAYFTSPAQEHSLVEQFSKPESELKLYNYL